MLKCFFNAQHYRKTQGINPYNYSYQLLQAGGICTVNVLNQDQLAIAGHFGRNNIADKMAGFVWRQDSTGAPILAMGLAYFDCRISHYADAGDHKIAICQVLAAKNCLITNRCFMCKQVKWMAATNFMQKINNKLLQRK